MWHRHEWVLISADDTYLFCAFAGRRVGITTDIVSQCTKCGKLRHDEMDGHHADVLMQKIRAGGVSEKGES